MRLWSLHPKYLDTKGLLAVWREGLLAQSCLVKGEYTCSCQGTSDEDGYYSLTNIPFVCLCECKGKKAKTSYYKHPQLERFKKENGKIYLMWYLRDIYLEAKNRGYKFNISKIQGNLRDMEGLQKLTVTKEQLEFEFKHLQNKLAVRDINKRVQNESSLKNWKGDYVGIRPHSIFHVIDGEIESWEKIEREK